MKRLFAILSAFTVCTAYAEAGNGKRDDDLPFRYEFRLGWSGYPTNDDMQFSDYEDHYWGDTSISDIFSSYDGPTYMTGNIMAEVDLHFRKWFTLSVGVAANGIWKDVYDAQTEKLTGRESGITMTLIPQARFTWARKGMMSFYSSVGIGLKGGRFDGYSDLYLAAQCSPFGFTIGKKLFGFAEVGFGSIYTGGMIGIGYRF